ncbi:MAG TPA: hypothetical protein PK698_06460 [Bacilli bacterium]|nr:hypothetical protein [Bacilli bacterium]
MRLSKEQLLRDVYTICTMAIEKKYFMTSKDIFALGYMCAKYDLDKIIDNQKKLIEACNKYDEDDDLALLDTIKETLIDLDIISNKKGE